jgi:precorrin-6B methylase 1
MNTNKPGRLVCVGTGMRMAGQITPMAQSCIETADVVVAAASNIFQRKWLQGLAKEYICLASHYDVVEEEGKNRRDTYRNMTATIMEQVRAGKNVCAAFYGHPGIFACISHMAIKEARAAGYEAYMEPGISAEDCLVADIGIDPGAYGMQSMESTQFMIYQRPIDPSGLLILWQPGLAGDLTLKRFDTEPARLQIMVDKLARHYPLDHEVILYEAATNPFEKTRIDRLPLRDLPAAPLKQITTLVIPPAQAFVRDEETIALLGALTPSNQLAA